MDTVSERLQASSSRIEELANSEQQLTVQNSSFDASLQELQKKVEESSALLATASSQFTAAESEWKKGAETLKSLRTDVNGCTTRIHALDTRESELKSKVDFLELEIKQVRERTHGIAEKQCYFDGDKCRVIK